MRVNLVLLLWLTTVLLGCTAAPTVTPPPPAPQTNPRNLATGAPPTATLSAPTATAPAAVQPTPNAPAVMARVSLLSLPGAGRNPAAVAQLGDTFYVADSASDNLAVIRDRRVRAFIPTARSPTSLVADGAHQRLYVGTYFSRTISLIENDTVARTAVLSDSVSSLALYQDKLFVGLGSRAAIEIRDPLTLEKKGQVNLSRGLEVLRLVVDAPRQRLIAGVYGGIVVLDLGTLRELNSFEAPSLFETLDVNPNDGSIWAGLYDDKQQRAYLAAYDQSGKRLRRVTVGADLRGLTFDDSGRAFVASSFDNQVDVVEAASGRVLANIHVGLHPTALWLDQPTHTLYVANENSDNLSVIDTQALREAGVIPLAADVSALEANQALGRVYAANASSDSVYVIEGGRVVNAVAVGHHPLDLADDPKTNRLFVANYADGTVSVVDENSLTVQATLPVTRALSTVAVDATNKHLFADSTMFALDTLQPQGIYLAQGFTLGSRPAAESVRVDPVRQKLYVLAFNGVPGSNSRLILYTFSETNLDVSGTLPYHNGGSVTALGVDPATGRVFATMTHPLAYTNWFVAWDAEGNELMEMALSARTTGMAFNPTTQHLFLAHANTYQPYSSGLPGRDNAVQVLDTRSFGEVGWLDVPGAPGPMTRLGSTIYVAGQDDGAITLIADVATQPPPSPTPTLTPTPYPTLPPSAPPSPTPQATRVPPSPVAVACANPPAGPFDQKWAALRDALGCPVGASESGSFAIQTFRDGYMVDDLRDPSAQVIYVLLPKHTYQSFPDTWKAGDPEQACPDVPIPPGRSRPKRGFGKVWCEHPDLQAQLPGAVADEAGVTLTVQRFEHGWMWANLPSGPVACFDDGTWQ
jgi:YVTN family beta-propeller protein